MAVPEFRSLLEIINIYADTEAQNRAADFLQRMGLPNAQEGEYFLGARFAQNNVARLYLPEGLSVSFVFRNVDILSAAWSWMFPSKAVEPARVYAARKVKDHEILQPLYQEDLGANCCVEIVPGIPRARVTGRELQEMQESLASRKLDFYMRQDEFVGLITDKDGSEQRLITNRRAVRIMPSYQFNDAADTGLQEKLFGPLRSEFNAAVGSGSAQTLQKLRAQCSDPSLPLFPYWQKMAASSERGREIVASATNYAMRLSAS